MTRPLRSTRGGMVYHVLNRANARAAIFSKAEDYAAFERVLAEAQRREPLRLLGYCLMPNHWHLIVWPKRGADRQVSEFMRWLTVTHTQRWHAHYHSSGTGHLYQGRFKSFPVQRTGRLLDVLRYVERNPLRASLVDRAEDWPFSSLALRLCSGEGSRKPAMPGGEGDPPLRPKLSPWPISRPADWVQIVNAPQTAEEVAVLHQSVNRGAPYGDTPWRDQVIERFRLTHTLRPRGRPRGRESKGI